MFFRQSRTHRTDHGIHSGSYKGDHIHKPFDEIDITVFSGRLFGFGEMIENLTFMEESCLRIVDILSPFLQRRDLSSRETYDMSVGIFNREHDTGRIPVGEFRGID